MRWRKLVAFSYLRCILLVLRHRNKVLRYADVAWHVTCYTCRGLPWLGRSPYGLPWLGFTIMGFLPKGMPLAGFRFESHFVRLKINRTGRTEPNGLNRVIVSLIDR